MARATYDAVTACDLIPEVREGRLRCRLAADTYQSGRIVECLLLADTCQSPSQRRGSASWPSADVLRLPAGGRSRPRGDMDIANKEGRNTAHS
jgi:hypothetical protein